MRAKEEVQQLNAGVEGLGKGQCGGGMCARGCAGLCCACLPARSPMCTFLTVCCCCLSSCCDVFACLQSLVRIPDTLLMAMEFLTLYTPSEHNQVMRWMQWV
jgi:hypothetical protein